MKLKGVVFDMDGVLVDNIAIHIEAFKLFCQRYPNNGNCDEIIMNSVGMGNNDILRLIMPSDEIEKHGIDNLAKEKEQIYREIYASRIEPIAGLKELLKEFKSRGIKCAVGSSGCKENVEFVINACGISEYFDVLIYSDLVTKCKPDPEIYQLAIKKLGIDPSSILVFEDAIAGIEAAKGASAGMIIALETTLDREVLERETGVHKIIRNFNEVLGTL